MKRVIALLLLLAMMATSAWMLGGCKALLGHIMVKADTQLFFTKMGNGTFADQNMAGRAAD